MKLTIKLAWRNIWRHRGKSLIIGLILFIGALLMTVGNGMISGMEKGLSENIVNLFTGDIVVISDQQKNDNVLFDMMGNKPLKVIKNYQEIKNVLDDEEMINKYLPLTAGSVFVFNQGSELETRRLLGVDIKKYQEFFPDNIQLTEGSMLKSGEHGLLISEKSRKDIYQLLNFWLLPEGGNLQKSKLPSEVVSDLNNLNIKRDLVFMGLSDTNSTVDVRVPVKGVIRYKSLNKIWGMYSIVDIESFREAHYYVTGTDSTVKLTKEKEQLLENNDPEQLFTADDSIVSNGISDKGINMDKVKEETRREENKYSTAGGAYNLIFLRLREGISQEKALQKLNNIFKVDDLDIRAVSWKDVIGTFGSMAVLIKGALNLFIMFIFFVAIIVIMNTLSMTAVERTAEIAVMRAVGARKGFLRKMFVGETGLLTFFFGGLGIVIGIIIIYFLRTADITTTNEILQLVYGGDRLNPIFTLIDLTMGIAELLIVSLLSVIYPLHLINRIVPLDVFNKEL